MAKYRSQIFKSVRDIDTFFQSLGSKGFVDWFNSNMANRDYWSDLRIKESFRLE
jgi:hypothetical protein